jgi:NAD(P)-dependent dehydrogenase (short-subunit alcohol dehydrogenase family)
VRADVRDPGECRRAVRECVERFGGLDVLVNNAAVQYPRDAFEDIEIDDLIDTFETNVFAAFYLVGAAIKTLRSRGGVIINTTSVTAYRGMPELVDYSATKGALVSFTRALSRKLAPDGVRVNAVAPGPIWTPLIPASFDADDVAEFGSDVPLGRAGEPAEVAGAYVYLASDDSTYVTGQVLHVNGGEIING